MKRLTGIIVVLIILIGLTAPGLTMANRLTGHTRADKPAPPADTIKWRIGYCESESFITYKDTLVAIVKGLEEIGWITDLEGIEQVALTAIVESFGNG